MIVSWVSLASGLPPVRGLQAFWIEGERGQHSAELVLWSSEARIPVHLELAVSFVPVHAHHHKAAESHCGSASHRTLSPCEVCRQGTQSS